MIPLYLKLHNFMSHEDTEIDFSKIDVACIQGSNGAGKSAIADGILYALFGQTSRGKDEDIVRLGFQDMTIIFDFDQAGQKYRVVRKKNITGRGRNLVEIYTLSSNGTTTALTTGDAAKEMILKILNRDFNTFISSSFLLQGKGERLITAKPSERYKVVFDILGLERYEEYRKKTVAVKNKTEGQKSALLESVEDFKVQAESLKYMETALDQKKSELKTVMVALDKNEKDLAQINSDLAVVNAKIEDIEKESEILKALEQENSEIMLLKYDLENSVKALPGLEQDIQNLYSHYSVKENGIQDAMTLLAEQKAKQGIVDTIRRELKDLGVQSVSIQKSISDTEKHIERYRKILENKQKILQLVEEEKSLTEKLQIMRKEIEKSTLRANALSADLRKWSELKTLLVKMQSIVLSKQKDRDHSIMMLKGKIEQARKKASLIQQSVCRAQGEFAKCPFLKDAIEERNSLETLSKQLDELERPLNIPEIKDIEALTKQITAIDAEKISSSINTENEKVKKVKEDIATLEKRLGVVSSWAKQASEINTAEIEVGRSEKIIGEHKKSIEEIGRRTAEMNKQLSEIDNIGTLIEVTEAVISRLKVASEIKTLQDKLSVNEKKIAEKKFSIGKVLDDCQIKQKELASRLENTALLVEKLKVEEKNCLLAVTKLESDILACKKASEKVKEMEKEISVLTRKHNVLQILENAYEKIPFYILDNVIPIMEEEANKILEEISTTGMRLELRTVKTAKTSKNVRDTLDIIVSDIAGERPIEMYSGGEKTRQVLAIAVGLAELSARKAGVKISTLLIDEPAGLDEQGLLDFGRSFIRLIETGTFKKGMLVAHEEILRDIFEQKILVKKEGSVSKVEVQI